MAVLLEGVKQFCRHFLAVKVVVIGNAMDVKPWNPVSHRGPVFLETTVILEKNVSKSS